MHHKPLPQTAPQLLGELLIARDLITADELSIALIEQRKTGKKLGEVLVYMGFVLPEVLSHVLGQSIGLPTQSLSGLIADPQALGYIHEDFARAQKIMPLAYDVEQNRLQVALTNPEDIILMDQLRRHVKNRNISFDFCLASEKEILASIDRCYGYELSIDGVLNELETGDFIQANSMMHGDEYAHPVVRLVNSLLTDAVKHNASDIHFEPEAFFIRLRYRMDGVLKQIRLLHPCFWSALLVRLKIITQMNISETRLPQDGRMTLMVAGRRIDLRASSQPTLYGENIVLRILDREKGIVPLAQLALPAETLQSIETMMARPTGILLVTGPTGSGKTTTLYSMINQLNHEGVNIVTLEDPVEYPMNGIRQTNINEDIGLSFANGIRSLMRQDPDVILVGEIRDEATAKMAMRAAMTGHQVYATLHANSVFSALPRLLDMGVEPSVLSGNITGILAQRLVRQLCPKCKVTYSATAAEKQLLAQSSTQTLLLCKAQGCADCRHTGYKGRVAVVETLRFDTEMDELIVQAASPKRWFAYAQTKGFQTMARMGFRLVLNGSTSLAELARVVDLTEVA